MNVALGVCWKTAMLPVTATTRNIRGKIVRGTGPKRKCARISLTDTLGAADVDVRCLGRVLEDGDVTCDGDQTEHSRKVREGTGYPAEMCWKLTFDVKAIRRAKHRRRLAIRQDADVA